MTVLSNIAVIGGATFPTLPVVEENFTSEVGQTKRAQVTATCRSHFLDERNKINQATAEEVTNLME
jgi:hypothetical protein